MGAGFRGGRRWTDSLQGPSDILLARVEFQRPAQMLACRLGAAQLQADPGHLVVQFGVGGIQFEAHCQVVGRLPPVGLVYEQSRQIANGLDMTVIRRNGPHQTVLGCRQIVQRKVDHPPDRSRPPNKPDPGQATLPDVARGGVYLSLGKKRFGGGQNLLFIRLHGHNDPFIMPPPTGVAAVVGPMIRDGSAGRSTGATAIRSPAWADRGPPRGVFFWWYHSKIYAKKLMSPYQT